MAIAVYFNPESLTLEQFDEINSQLQAGGNGERPDGGLHLSCFGEDGHLMVFNVWESQEAFETFGKVLMPIISGLGIKVEPAVMPVHRLDQPEAHIGMG